MAESFSESIKNTETLLKIMLCYVFPGQKNEFKLNSLQLRSLLSQFFEQDTVFRKGQKIKTLIFAEKLKLTEQVATLHE